MTRWIIEWTDGKGKDNRVIVDTEKARNAWCRKLDKRFDRGTCGGYVVTQLGG